MKTIKVVAAIITHEEKILATQRGYGEFKGGWELDTVEWLPADEGLVERLKG